MKRISTVLAVSLVAAVFLGLTSLAHGQLAGVVFREKFDGYANDTQLGLVWPNTGGSTPTGGLATNRFVSSPKSLYHPGGAYQRYHEFASVDAGTALVANDANPILLKFKWYEDGATNKRFSVEFSSNAQRGIGAWDAFLEFGVYNSEPQDQYWSRTVNVGGTNWAAMTGTARNRSTPGWRDWRVLIYATKITVQVDGLPATPWEIATPSMSGKKWVSVAFGSPSDIASTGGGGNLDDLHVSYLSDENAGPQCTDVPPVTINEILYAGKTTVNVSNVDPAATKVSVYADGNLIGSSTAAPFASTVAITVPALTNGQSIKATQNKDVTVAGFPTENIESCMPATGRVVGDCQQVAAVDIGNILAAGATTVQVIGIDPTATLVSVYKNGAGPAIGTAAPAGNSSVDVTVSALAAGDVVSATQTVSSVEGCIPTSGKIVGSCSQVPTPTIVGYPGNGDQSVTVGNIRPDASLVSVYVGGAAPAIGSINPNGASVVVVPVSSALVAGTTVSATQTVIGIEGCVGTTNGKVVRAISGMIEDFQGTFSTLTNPPPTPGYSVWYNVSDIAYSTASVINLFGSQAMKIADPGYTNGVYAIYQSVVPATGLYHVKVQMMVDERASGANLDFFKNYQIGVVAGGTHRSQPGRIDAITASGKEGVGNYTGPLTANQDGPPVETAFYTVYSSTFSGDIGDDLLIAFSTDVSTLNQNGASNGAAFVVDNIQIIPGPKPADCSDVPGATVMTAPLEAGMTQVQVGNLHQAATLVKVWASSDDGETYTEIGQGDPGSGTTFFVTVDPLVAGDYIRATQIVDMGMGNGPQESCILRDGPTVGTGENAPLTITLGVREITGSSGPLGADGGISGTIEWVGATGTAGGAPIGKALNTEPTWQTITFNPVTDPKLAFPGSGNGTIGTAWGTLEHLAFSIAAPYNSGRYVINIDSIYNGEDLLADFDDDQVFVAGQLAMFRKPSYSGTTNIHLMSAPDVAEVDATMGADGSDQSVKVSWQYLDGQSKRWLRLTTDGTGTTMPLKNPLIDLSKTVTIKLRMYGPPSSCGDVPFDADHDGDVDMEDFAAFQRCLTIGGGTVAAECACFDRPFNGVINLDDLAKFENCASGAGVDAVAGCAD